MKHLKVKKQSSVLESTSCRREKEAACFLHSILASEWLICRCKGSSERLTGGTSSRTEKERHIVSEFAWEIRAMQSDQALPCAFVQQAAWGKNICFQELFCHHDAIQRAFSPNRGRETYSKLK